MQLSRSLILELRLAPHGRAIHPGTKLPFPHVRAMSVIVVPAQAVDATQALNRWAGVWKPKVLRGRSLSCRATLLSCGCV